MMIEKEDTIYQTLDLGKVILKGEFIAVTVYIEIEDKSIRYISY